MEDLTGYSDQELSLRVFNEEYLYDNRNRGGFLDMLDEFFIYTQTQKDELTQDLTDDLKETN